MGVVGFANKTLSATRRPSHGVEANVIEMTTEDIFKRIHLARLQVIRFGQTTVVWANQSACRLSRLFCETDYLGSRVQQKPDHWPHLEGLETLLKLLQVTFRSLSPCLGQSVALLKLELGTGEKIERWRGGQRWDGERERWRGDEM